MRKRIPPLPPAPTDNPSEKSPPPPRDEYLFVRRVDFYSWLSKKGCPKFLDHVNLQNSIVNALIAAFTISACLNLFSFAFLFALDYYAGWFTFNYSFQILITTLSFLALAGVTYYNKKYWRRERYKTLEEISEEYANRPPIER